MEYKVFLKTDTAKTSETIKIGGCSFEKYYLNAKHEKSNPKHPLNKRKLKFVDDIDPEKPFEEIVDVESFKQFNVNIMDEIENETCRTCTCMII